MQNKHRHKNLRPFLNQDVDAKDVLSSHAYGKVARESDLVPSRPPMPIKRHSAHRYKDSMVGSLAQYRERVVKQPKVPDTPADTSSDEPVVGNRPHRGTAKDKKAESNSVERRRHFIEPPKRRFNPFG